MKKGRVNVLEDFKSLSVIPRTAKLPGFGKFSKRGFVLAMNLNSLESTSVRWKGVVLGILDSSRSKENVNNMSFTLVF